jgi:murein DD-endopeptidase MepM/ murein hydrolase activator NlpD
MKKILISLNKLWKRRRELLGKFFARFRPRPPAPPEPEEEQPMPLPIEPPPGESPGIPPPLDNFPFFQPNGFPAFLWPSTYEPPVVTQPFGVNGDYYGKFGLPGHEGIDMRAPLGQEIVAVWDGEVARVGWHKAYGNHIRLNHFIDYPGGENVHLESIYAHFAHPSDLRVGDKVRRGEVIGYADSTGNSSGHHLHLGVKQFDHPELRPPMDEDWPYDLIDCTVFFAWMEE